MKNDRIISTGRGLAYLIIVLGLIHEVATFSPLIKGGLLCLSSENLNAMLYMSLMCGASLILSGVIILLLLQQIGKYLFISTILLVIGCFLAINGFLSVYFMFNNPFAWVAFILNIWMFCISVVLRNRFMKSVFKTSI